jgi:hypothetical protein
MTMTMMMMAKTSWKPKRNDGRDDVDGVPGGNPSMDDRQGHRLRKITWQNEI